MSIELELQVLDADNLLLVPRAADIVHAVGSHYFRQGISQHTLVLISDACSRVEEIERDLGVAIAEAVKICDELGLVLCGSGTHPLVDVRDNRVIYSEDFKRLNERRQYLIRRMTVFGMRIDLNVTNVEDTIDFGNFFLHFVPHLIALSSSSPFLHGFFTGLSSSRTTAFEGFPTVGISRFPLSLLEYHEMYDEMRSTGAIENLEDLLWDVRPNPEHNSLSILCCDQCSTSAEILGIISFVHSLACWFEDHRYEWIVNKPEISQWMVAENRWRAIQQGVRAKILLDRAGRTQSVAQGVKEWDHRLTTYIKKLNYERYMGLLINSLRKGTSSERQYRVYARRNSLLDVVRHNAEELRTGVPQYPRQITRM
jgi:carboxylate-amine ligase